MPHAHNGDVELAYEVHGEGEPLLLVQGLGGTKEWWFPQIEHFAASHRVIAYDNRGVGDSDVPYHPWQMADMAADAVAILDAEAIESAHVVGVSMGGMIAQHVALNHPGRVRHLVLCATTPGLHHGFPDIEVLAGMLGGGKRTRAQIARDNLKLLFTDETMAAMPELMERTVELGTRHAAPARGFRHQVGAVIGHNTKERLRELAHRTLVLTGDRDTLIPPLHSQLLAEAIVGAHFEVLEDTAHGFLLDRAADANRLIEEFLRS